MTLSIYMVTRIHRFFSNRVHCSKPEVTRTSTVHNPLPAPACELPPCHVAVTEALLSSLNYPRPHRERPTTTRTSETDKEKVAPQKGVPYCSCSLEMMASLVCVCAFLYRSAMCARAL